MMLQGSAKAPAAPVAKPLTGLQADSQAAAGAARVRGWGCPQPGALACVHYTPSHILSMRGFSQLCGGEAPRLRSTAQRCANPPLRHGG